MSVEQGGIGLCVVFMEAQMDCSRSYSCKDRDIENPAFHPEKIDSLVDSQVLRAVGYFCLRENVIAVDGEY